jgi:hypothetical protein
MSTALVPKDAYRRPPDLVAWWTGHAYTTWHINGTNGRTACGRAIGTERLTRRHHPAADVCAACRKPAPEVTQHGSLSQE